MKIFLILLLTGLAGCGAGPDGSKPLLETSTRPVSGKNTTFGLSFNFSLKTLFSSDEVKVSSGEYTFFNHGLDITVGLPEKKKK